LASVAISNAAGTTVMSKPAKAGTHRKLLEMGVENLETAPERSPAELRALAGMGQPDFIRRFLVLDNPV
jgi:hypothetical protein